MIKKLIIENYRSFSHEEIQLGALNAFIGPNNAGKSNIMTALNVVLGDIYPSPRSFSKKDFHNYLSGTSNAIKIEVLFDAPLNCDRGVHGFHLKFDGNDCDYYALDSVGLIAQYGNGREKRVTNEMKSEVALLYVGLNREASAQLRGTQNTLFGKMIRHIEKQLATGVKDGFKGDIKNSYQTNIYPALQQMEDLMRIHVRRQIGADLHLHLSVLDPVEMLKNLRPMLREDSTGTEFDAEDMGAGTQSALAVAIARAYAEIVRQPLVIAIEEPELYLHPQGCRNFYQILRELSANGVQIIYTTHERSFVDIFNFNSIHLVRKHTGNTNVSSGIDKSISSTRELYLASKFNDEINEVFFAQNCILTEGIADKIACCFALQKLGIEIDRDNISVIDCGSNTGIKPIGEVLHLFNIPFVALMDEDPGNSSTSSLIADVAACFGVDCVFLQRPTLETMFGFTSKPSKVESLTMFPAWLSQHDVPQVYVDVKTKLGY